MRGAAMRTVIFKRGHKEYDLQIDGINASCLLRVFNVSDQLIVVAKAN